MPSRLATIPQRKNKRNVSVAKKARNSRHCLRSFAMVTLAPRECFFKAHFSRKMTSPWPTSWSFNHKRYL